MANKKTIQAIELDLDRLHNRLTRTVRKINELRDLRKKIRKGQVKQPPPPGVKVKFEKPEGFAREDFDDVIPSFGPQGS